MGCSSSSPETPAPVVEEPPPPPAPPAPVLPSSLQVFISNRAPEASPAEQGGKGFAVRAQKALEIAGYSVFLQDDITGGAPEDLNTQAITKCSVLVPFISASACSSEQAGPDHSAALQLSESLQKPVVPVHVDGTWPPAELTAALQGLDKVPKEHTLVESSDLDADMHELLLALWGLGIKPEKQSKWRQEQEDRELKERQRLEEEEAARRREQQKRIKKLIATNPAAAFLDSIQCTDLIEPVCTSLYIYQPEELGDLAEQEAEAVHSSKDQQDTIADAVAQNPTRCLSDDDKRHMCHLPLHQLLASHGLTRHESYLKDRLQVAKASDLGRLFNTNRIDSVPGMTRFEKKRLLDLCHALSDGAELLEQDRVNKLREEERLRQAILDEEARKRKEDKILSIVVSGGKDRMVRIWNLRSGECEETLQGHTDDVNSVTIGADCKTIISGSSDRTVRVWARGSHSVDSSCVAVLQGHTESVTSVALSPDGKTVVSGSWDMTVRIWSIAESTCRAVLKGHTQKVTCVAISPDGLTIASGSSDKTTRLWNFGDRSCTSTLEGHSREVSCLAFSPDCRYLATGSFDKTIRIWRLHSRQLRSILPEVTAEGHTEWVSSVAFTPDGKHLVSGSFDWRVCVWSLETGRRTSDSKGHTLFVSGVAVARDGRTAVSCSGDKVIRWWDLTSGTCKAKLRGHADSIYSVSMVP